MKPSSDPIADMLTRIRNAQSAGHKRVGIPASKLKVALAKRLEQYGYVANVTVEDIQPQPWLWLDLKYDGNEKPLITNLKRISKPSCRVYVGSGDIPKVLNGLGLAILSTSKGILTDREAKASNVGGELLCTVY